MGGKGKVKIPVADYLMSIHYGICKGPLDSINQIFIKEKRVWCGLQTDQGEIDVDLPELFGGDKKEGGPSGIIECYIGTGDQLMSAPAAARHDKTPTTMPGYRGIASLFFRGRAAGGFKWLCNNPYLPGAWVNVTRLPKGLTDSWSAIYETDPTGGGGSGTVPVVVGYPGWAEFDLLSLGIANAVVDAGNVSFSTNFGFYLNGAAQGACRVDVECLDELGGVINTFENVADIQEPNAYGGINLSVPSLTRTVRVLLTPLPNPGSGVDSFLGDDSYFEYFGSGGDILHCEPDSLGKLPDANPAHMIYEALTDKDWGMGTPATLIDMSSFLYAAELFYNERFGLSIAWMKKAEINVYISEILDHVQANLFMDPRTGLWTLVPLRGDYDPDTLPILDPSNCTAINRQRKAFGETVNEIVVTWTNPNNEKEETVSLQDLANIAMQDGEVVSADRNYYGVRNAALAMKLCARDLRAAAYPIWGCDIVANRKMSFLRPGSVAKLNWPEDGIEGMIVRVGKVDYGRPGDSAIKFPVTEDVFALDVATFTGTQGSQWQTPEVTPSPMPYVQPLTAPLPLLLRSGVALADLADEDYPEVVTAVLADHDIPVEFIELNGPLVRPNGDTYVGALGNVLATPSGSIQSRWPAEVSTLVSMDVVAAIAAPAVPQPGDFMYLSLDGSDALSEIVMLDAVVGSDWVVARGMFDTVPREWPYYSRAWFLGDDLDARDPTAQTVGVEIPYQLRTKTSGGLLGLGDAPIIPFTPSERPYLPFRPADVAFAPVDGTFIFATVEAGPGALSPLLYWVGDQPTSIDITWANRNRLTEDTVAPRWTAGTITPEVGQTTTVRLRDLDTNTILTTSAGLTGTSTTFDVSAITGAGRFAVEVLAVRDGFESLQFAAQVINVIEPGYGNAYGLSYST